MHFEELDEELREIAQEYGWKLIEFNIEEDWTRKMNRLIRWLRNN